MELLIGSGNRHEKQLAFDTQEWTNLVTLDIDPAARPDYLWDLNHLPLPFPENYFDEIHAYDVLEHVGQQGDWKFFFAQFSDFWRMLKPGGFFFGKSPRWDSPWAWGDPGHTRVIQPEQLYFLSQHKYATRVGVSPMTDYRAHYSADFRVIEAKNLTEHLFAFVLEAVK